jgi:hypothetical protein
MISYHTDPTGYPVYKWRSAEVFSLQGASDFVTKLWSGITWVGGCRAEENFSSSMWCALDFDEGVSKGYAIEALHGFAFILAPTKSDGLEKGKGKPACDRFRILLKFADEIADLDVYRHNMRLMTERFRSDAQPIDGARCWQPSKCIEVAQFTGDALPVVYDIPVEETQQAKQEKIIEAIQERKARGLFPRHVKDFLKGRVERGTRNIELFRAACVLLHCGYDIREIRKIVGAIPEMRDHDKTEDTLKSACKRCQANYE